MCIYILNILHCDSRSKSSLVVQLHRSRLEILALLLRHLFFAEPTGHFGSGREGFGIIDLGIDMHVHSCFKTLVGSENCCELLLLLSASLLTAN